MSEQTSTPDEIDFNAPILNILGAPMNQRNEDGATMPLRLGDVAIGALCGVVPGEKVDGVQRFKRLQLALKIQHSAGEEEDGGYGILKLKETQRKMILTLAASVVNPQTGLPVFSTLVYGRIHEVLRERPDEEE